MPPVTILNVWVYCCRLPLSCDSAAKSSLRPSCQISRLSCMQQQAAFPPQSFRHFMMSSVMGCKSTALPSLQVGALLLTGISGAVQLCSALPVCLQLSKSAGT